MAKGSALNFITTLVVILAGLIPFSFELIKEDSTNITGLILLTSIAVFIVFYFIYMFIWSNIKRYIAQIEMNKSKLNELEKKFDYKEDFYKLEKRVSMMEVKNAEKRPNRS